MEFVIVAIVVGVAALLVVPLAMLGVFLLREGLTRRARATVPIAQVVVGATTRFRDPAPRWRRGLSRAVTAVLGASFLGAAMVVVAWTWRLLAEGVDLMPTLGRALRVGGRVRCPAAVADSCWSDGAAPSVAGLTDDERCALAAAWQLAAEMEHASIAAFADLSLQLAALGAPPDLVERTHQAALDEIRHARRSFALAGSYRGAPLSAGPILALASGRRTRVNLVSLAIASLVDGCEAEGVAADLAAAAAAGATDPVVRATLAMIAADEERHAELAWSIVAWCRDAGGEPVRAAVAARASRLVTKTRWSGPDYGSIASERLTALGLVDEQSTSRIASRRATLVAARALATPAEATERLVGSDEVPRAA